MAIDIGQSLDSFDDDRSSSDNYISISKTSSSPSYNNAVAHYSVKGSIATEKRSKKDVKR